MSTGAFYATPLGAVSAEIVTCDEQSPVDIELSEVLNPDGTLRLNPEIERGDYFQISLKKSVLTLRARAFVGFVPLNEKIVVYIRPRTKPSNLTRIVEVSGQPATTLSTMRGYSVGGEWRDSLLDLYAGTLLRHLEVISQQGLWREYARREERSSFPHGRIMVHQTIQQLASRGIDHMAQVSWFERTADTPANRCLKYAVWLLGQKYMALKPIDSASRRIHRRLNAAYSMFDDAELDLSRRFLDDSQVCGARELPTVRAYYREALDLALAVVEERAILLDGRGDDIALPSMVVNMDSVFEAYVRNVVKRAAESEGWGVTVHDANTEAAARLPLFDTPTMRSATPDVVLRLPDDTFPLVGEIKNQPSSNEPDRDAIEQAVTYALRYRTGQVVIFTPCTAIQTSALRHLGDIDTVRVFHYRVNLGAADLVAEEARLADAVLSLI